MLFTTLSGSKCRVANEVDLQEVYVGKVRAFPQASLSSIVVLEYYLVFLGEPFQVCTPHFFWQCEVKGAQGKWYTLEKISFDVVQWRLRVENYTWILHNLVSDHGRWLVLCSWHFFFFFFKDLQKFIPKIKLVITASVYQCGLRSCNVIILGLGLKLLLSCKLRYRLHT